MEGDKHVGKLYSFSAGFVSAAVVFVFLLTSYAVVSAAWSEPSLSPPDGNIDAPLNKGLENQTKLGKFTIIK